MKRTENQGNIGGARLLLKRLVKNEAGWFSQFLQALEDTEHHELVRELRGEPCNEDGEARNHVLHQAEVKHHSQYPTVSVCRNLRINQLEIDSSGCVSNVLKKLGVLLPWN